MVDIQTKTVKTNGKNGYIYMNGKYIGKEFIVLTLEDLEFIAGRKLKQEELKQNGTNKCNQTRK